MTTPLESNSRTESFGPSAHTASSFRDGNAARQPGSSSSLKPPSPASREKMTGHVLSRAALEISHAPTMAFAASLGAGACADAWVMEITSAPATDKARRDIGTPTQRMTRHIIMPGARRHADPAADGDSPSKNASVSRAPPRGPRRFRHRGERRLARHPGQEVVDHELIHLLAGRNR